MTLGVYKPEPFRYVKDDDIVGMVTCGFITGIILTVVLIHFIYKTKKSKEPISDRLKIFAIIHIFCDWVFCWCAALIRSDTVLPISYNIPNTLNPNLQACRATAYTPYFFYYCSKVFLYLFFIERIEVSFGDSSYKCSRFYLIAFRVSVILSCSILLILFMVYESFQYCKTPRLDINLCSVYTENISENLGGLALVIMSVLDLFYSSIALGIFGYKLRRLTIKSLHYDESRSSHSNNPNDNNTNSIDNKYHKYKRSINVTLKCAVLSSTSVCANWLFLFFGMTLLFDLGWFLCIDCFINGICIYLMFRANQRLYYFLCCPCIVGWSSLLKLFGINSNYIQQIIIFNKQDDIMSNTTNTLSVNSANQIEYELEKSNAVSTSN